MKKRNPKHIHGIERIRNCTSYAQRRLLKRHNHSASRVYFCIVSMWAVRAEFDFSGWSITSLHYLSPYDWNFVMMFAKSWHQVIYNEKLILRYLHFLYIYRFCLGENGEEEGGYTSADYLIYLHSETSDLF